MTDKYSAFGPIMGTAGFKCSAEDFEVSETLRFTPEGTGDHLYLYVQKENANTEWMQKLLAKSAGVSLKDTGYAGLKDRYSISRQWISIYSPHNEPALNDLPDNIQILSRTRGQKKLKTGAVGSNSFNIRLNVEDLNRIELAERFNAIKENGFPNYFGDQRFGKDGSNVQKLIAMGKGKRCKPAQRSMYLSAGRSFLFNQMLNARVVDQSWNQFRVGDVAILNGARSFFPVEALSNDLTERLNTFDVHPALPLYGKGAWPSTCEQSFLEDAVYAANPEVISALDKFKMTLMPRAARVLPGEMQWHITDKHVEIAFTLPSGAFATSLLEQVFILQEPERDCGQKAG